MAYNNGFPVTYPQIFPQYPTYQPMQAMQPQPVQQQGMTPPTVHADIVQVSSEAEAAAFPVAAGASQMMVAKDDSASAIRASACAPGSIRPDSYFAIVTRFKDASSASCS